MKIVLTELFVEDEYIVNSITDKNKAFYELLLEWFSYDIFSFQEVKEKCNVVGISQYAASQWLNKLFRYGCIRKFKQGDWTNAGKWNETAQKVITGYYYGVHYKIREHGTKCNK